jgi:hypothetical protein
MSVGISRKIEAGDSFYMLVLPAYQSILRRFPKGRNFRIPVSNSFLSHSQGKAAKCCWPSVCLRITVEGPLDELSWNLLLERSTQICLHIPFFTLDNSNGRLRDCTCLYRAKTVPKGSCRRECNTRSISNTRLIPKVRSPKRWVLLHAAVGNPVAFVASPTPPTTTKHART